MSYTRLQVLHMAVNNLVSDQLFSNKWINVPSFVTAINTRYKVGGTPTDNEELLRAINSLNPSMSDLSASNSIWIL